MYQALLTKRYLTSKIMPLLAALAVALCTTMVLVVWSVMGGFLSSLLNAGRSMIGDVAIVWPNAGFPHYDDLIKRLEADKQFVGAATPLIETLGLVSLPDERLEGVQIKGIDAKSYPNVVDWNGALWWKPLDEPLRRDHKKQDERLDTTLRPLLSQTFADGKSLTEINPTTKLPVPAAIPGIELMGLSRRNPAGFYSVNQLLKPRTDGRAQSISEFAANASITVNVLPLATGGRQIAIRSRQFPVANEFRTGVFEVDKRTVFVPLEALQQMMYMDAAGIAVDDPDPYAPTAPNLNPPNAKYEPARVTTVLVRAADGITPDQLRKRCVEIYREFAQAHKDVPSGDRMDNANLIRTWEQQQETFVGAVKKETALILMLLWLISLVASFLILAIFWAMISEKTRDIGILRAIGASGPGIAWVWIRYGLVIGLLGASIGLALAYLIVTNINPIHEWLGTALGIYVWDPRVYYFTEIPSNVDPTRAAIVFASGVIFSLLGSIVPATRAALLRPVQALRFE